MEDAAFPRGKIVADADVKKGSSKKKRRSSSAAPLSNKKRQPKDDFLFGEKKDDEANRARMSKRSRLSSSGDNENDGATTTTRGGSMSLLPLGGGGTVVATHGKNSGDGNGWIEPLSFQKLHAGFTLLGCVKQVLSDVCIVSLPNLWTGFMLRDNSSATPLDERFSMHQMIPVTITKAVLESVVKQHRKSGQRQQQRRRIQVKLAANPVDLNIPGLPLHGTVVSTLDHGVLLDLGLKRRGFLPFAEIASKKFILDGEDHHTDDDDHNNDTDNAVVDLSVHRVVHVVVRAKASDTAIVPLSIPSNLKKMGLPDGYVPALQDLRPGTLIPHVKLEQTLRNGLAVTFGPFRGAIELAHLGAHWIPSTKAESSASSSWKDFFERHRVFPARILAVDPKTKIVRLTMAPHLLALEVPTRLPEPGVIVPGCTVLRVDPGLGALLALHSDVVHEREQSKARALFKPLSNDEDYLDATRVRTAYVHISKAMDDNEDDGKTSDAVFAKEFALSTKHTIRILSAQNMIEGMASGASAPSILKAHVLMYSDIKAGTLYRQVPVCGQLESGGILVDFGMGIRGLIPSDHRFDQTGAVASEYSAKRMKVKYSIGAKVDVRVLSVDTAANRCMLTAKKSLTKANDTEIITSYEDLKLGSTGIGVISKVDKAGLYVSFFNGVYGRVTARSLAAELGVENHKENYHRGDVISCRVVKLAKRSKRNETRFKEDNMEVDDDDADHADNNTRHYYELTLSLRVNGVGADDSDKSSRVIQLLPGAVIPSKALKVIELCRGKKKEKRLVAGYARVHVKSKHFVAENSTMPEFIECKLPFDQLLDNYKKEDLASADALYELASKMLSVGEKIKQKAILLADPKKAQSEYECGTGGFAVVSLRSAMVETAAGRGKKTGVTEESMKDQVFLPGPSTHFYIGALVQGYVVRLEPRHGAFVRFLDGMTGLVPKLKGGLALKLYSTVVVEVVAVDDKIHPPRILLGLTRKEPVSSGFVTPEPSLELGPSPVQPGHIVREAEVVELGFHRLRLKILDEDLKDNELVAAQMHCTLAKSKTLPSSGQICAGSTEQTISKFHPFFKITVGKTLKNLRVVSVTCTKRAWIVDLSNMDESLTLVEDKPVQGTQVSGIVTAISKHHGLWLQLSPSVSAHLPGLEISEDCDVLNNVAKYFPLGSRLEATVLDKKACDDMRKKYLKRQNNKNEEEEHNGKKGSVVFLTLLKEKRFKPEYGGFVVGSIDRMLTAASEPDVMLNLRGGYIGRCCVTELAEVDDWTNFPLGRSKGKAITNTKKRKDMESDDESERDDTSTDLADITQVDSHAFPHGFFVRCRVLAASSSKTVVDVSLRLSRLEGDLDDDEPPEVDETVQAYVVNTSNKGCFVRLSRRIGGRTLLKELSDGFLPNPAATFPTGRLVVGKVKAIKESRNGNGTKFTTDFDMRESQLVTDFKETIKFESISVGSKFKGSVTRIEEYGVFVRIDSSDVSGLVHKSECSDKFVKSLASLYDPGDLVKLLVIKKDDDKKQVGFSMKASHFEDDEDSSDDDSDSDMESRMLTTAEDELDSDDEDYASKLAKEMRAKADESEEVVSDSEDNSSESDDKDDNSESSDSDEESEKQEGGLDTNVGFDWNGGSLSSKATMAVSEDDESDSSEDDDGDDVHKSSHKSRKKQAERRREEVEVSRRETALADGTADENPETASDFERMLAGDPNSSELWIRFMAFHLTLANVAAAREVAERAFARIEFREEKEKLNVWCALLTLELKYGIDETLQKVLDRASQHNNPKHVYLRMCEMMEKQSASPEAARKTDEMFAKMCKKFKSKKQVWIAYMEYLLRDGRHEDAQALSKRALLSLKSYKHVETMSKFAQLVFEYGSAEKARTIFEGLLTKYPKRLDLISVYADKEVKHGELDAARSIFTRVVNPNDETLPMKFSDKQMKKLFKKWFTFEETHGTDETQENVKDAARDFVERSL